MKYTLLILLFFFNIQLSKSQNYQYVDSIVSIYPKKFRSIESFAKKIDIDFKTDLEKVKAAYYWISNNIIYDYKTYRSNENGYDQIEMKSEEYYQNRLLEMQKDYAERALKRKLAICEGYSQLLKFTLQELNIECEVISGYAKISAREIGIVRIGENHAWNAVRLNNEWKLIDATWSTGNDEMNPEFFDFTDTYFFVKPEDLILTHRPKEEKWQLLNEIVSIEKFFYKPIFNVTYFDSELQIEIEQSGLIKAKTGERIQISFDQINTDATYSYAFKEDISSTEFIFKKNGDKFIAEIPFPHKRNSTLTLFENNISCIEFKIILDR